MRCNLILREHCLPPNLEEIDMAQCVFCGAETVLFDSGTPICVRCDNEREQKKNFPYSPRKRDVPQADAHDG